MRTFIISDEEEAKAKAFYDELMEERNALVKDEEDDYVSPFPNLIYSFTETGIGTHIEVRDTLSGKKLDITDYSCW